MVPSIDSYICAEDWFQVLCHLLKSSGRFQSNQWSYSILQLRSTTIENQPIAQGVRIIDYILLFFLHLVQEMLSTKLSMKFRNMRRKTTRKSRLYSGASATIKPAGASEEEKPSPSVQEKPSPSVEEKLVEDEGAGPTASYEENVEALQKACAESKKEMISHLLVATFNHRQIWIKEEMPAVQDVLKKYPCFNKIEYVSYYNDY